VIGGAIQQAQGWVKNASHGGMGDGAGGGWTPWPVGVKGPVRRLWGPRCGSGGGSRGRTRPMCTCRSLPVASTRPGGGKKMQRLWRFHTLRNCLELLCGKGHSDELRGPDVTANRSSDMIRKARSSRSWCTEVAPSCTEVDPPPPQPPRGNDGFNPGSHRPPSSSRARRSSTRTPPSLRSASFRLSLSRT